MKTLFILLVALPIALFSCKKTDKCLFAESELSASPTERAYLQNYVSSNAIVAIEHASGVFYTITNPGSGTNPTICSNITVKYTGSLIPTGTVFDSTPTSSQGTSFSLGQLIVGWQKVLPLLKTGGKITLYIPPSLGYGQQNIRDNFGNMVIPGNSYLKFELELVNVQ